MWINPTPKDDFRPGCHFQVLIGAVSRTTSNRVAYADTLLVLDFEPQQVRDLLTKDPLPEVYRHDFKVITPINHA